MERLVDTAARETGRDPAAEHNPEGAIPFRAASGLDCDSGDFAAVLDAGLERADWAGFAASRRASEINGKLRGTRACLLSRGHSTIRRWAGSASSRTGG
jgi:carbon-monoxide dehydrogenase large subunit